jgi:hypothetical protein
VDKLLSRGLEQLRQMVQAFTAMRVHASRGKDHPATAER